MSTIDDAIQNIRMGNREEGRQILEELLETNENNAEIWLWLSSVVESDEDREICLENVVALEPDNAVARKGLEALQSGTFNVNDLLSDALEELEEVEEEDPTTFLDEFMTADDGDLDSDLDFDDFGDGSGSSGRAGLNVRVIILAVLAVILVVVLAAVGFIGYSRIGGGSSVEGNPPLPQETPAGGQQSTENANEATPTPGPPTDTPTPSPSLTITNTPKPALELPTAEPTDLPTPTATRVVSPTPAN